MFQKIGVTELVLILILALIVFGPSKLPEIGRAIGQSFTEFKKGINEISEVSLGESNDEEKKENENTNTL